MIKFRFTTTPDTQKYSEDVVYCLIKHGGKSEKDAVSLFEEFMKDTPVFDNENFLLHEDAYYTAMCIIHHPVLGDNKPNWWQNPMLWPPPKDRHEWYGKEP